MTDRWRKAMINWIHAGPSVTAAFLGSLVECVEAVTIVLAVGTVRGWRSALLGTAGGLGGPRALGGPFGPPLGGLSPTLLQLGLGGLLLLVRLRRLRKGGGGAGGRLPLDRGGGALKFAVGVLLGSFGAFWIGEGLGVHWPGADLSILGLAGGFLILSLLTVVALRTEHIQRGAA